MKLKLFEKISLPKIVGRYGVLAVDTFSTLIFFMLLGASWVLATTGSIFALVKIWHWQESWKAKDRLRRYLHRSTWLILAVLSVYFLITLALSITQTPEEALVDGNAAALEEAIAVSRIATVQSLTREQEMLLGQNESLAGRLMTLNQWSDAFRPMQSQMNANLDRLGTIAGELNRIRAEQAAESRALSETKNGSDKIKFQPVKPIGAQNLMGRVVPENMVNVSIILLFTFVGIVLEITMALSSLPAETWEKTDNEKTWRSVLNSVEALSPAEPDTPKTAEKENAGFPTFASVAELDLRPKDFEEPAAKENEQKTDGETAAKAPKGRRSRKRYGIDQIQEFIDIAYQDDGSFLPSGTVTSMPKDDCQGILNYLKTLHFKGSPVVELRGTAYFSALEKDKLKKFVSLQGGGA